MIQATEDDMETDPQFDPLSLELDSILAEAQQTAGSDEFGDEAFREPFERLVAALECEARRNAVGRGMRPDAAMLTGPWFRTLLPLLPVHPAGPPCLRLWRNSTARWRASQGFHVIRTSCGR